MQNPTTRNPLLTLNTAAIVGFVGFCERYESRSSETSWRTRLSLSVVMGSFLGSRLTGSLGARRTMSLGLLGICGATLLISGISAEGGLPYVLSNAVLAVLSLGCSTVASTTRRTAAVEGEERGLASGVLNSSAQIGTALGLAALITVAAARTGALAGGEQASAIR
jgi:hypothetical protein